MTVNSKAQRLFLRQEMRRRHQGRRNCAVWIYRFGRTHRGYQRLSLFLLTPMGHLLALIWKLKH